VRLTELPRRKAALVEGVEDHAPNDAIARRLRELGFVAGEQVEVMAAGPLGAEPLLVQVGFTRFALRRAEAERVRIRVDMPVVDIRAQDASVEHVRGDAAPVKDREVAA
jgi:ferrous iron transport protein A